jgi:glycosyltransferase involved in cell wall biosynthesis
MTTFFGPVALAGIGQVMKKYSTLASGRYIEYGQPFDGSETGVAFVLPVKDIIDILKGYSSKCKNMIYMTICETETVHESHEVLFELSDTYYVASEFCSTIFKRQFPTRNFPILHLYSYPPKECIKFDIDLGDAYVFYHIGNIADPRKNIKKLVECFIRAELPNTYLLLKATCKDEIKINVPGVVVINGLISDEHLEYIHTISHCYVSMSHSEGAGMGAIEAAMHHKPVIFPEYGATKEYIDTQWIVPCKMKEVGIDDFLFKKEFQWGDPDMNSMIEHMKDIHAKRPFVTHQKTYDIMSKVPVNLMNLLKKNMHVN